MGMYLLLRFSLTVQPLAINHYSKFALLFPTQIISIITTFYAIPFLIKLGPSNTARFILSIASPLAALIIPPFLGTRSDLLNLQSLQLTRNIISTTILVIFSLLSLSFCQPIASLLTNILPLDQGDWDPQRDANMQSISILIGILSLYPLTFALNALIQSIRTILLQHFSADSQPRINISITRLLRLADLSVFILVSISPSSDLHGPSQPQLLRKLVAFSIPVMIISNLITYLYCQNQSPPLETQPTTVTSLSPRLKNQFKLFKQTLIDLPIPIWRLCYVEMLSSTCWLTILYHAKPLVSQLTLVELSSKGAKLTESLVRYAERQGTKAMLNFSIVSLLTALILPRLATVGTTELMMTRRGKGWNRVRRTLAYITPRNLWTFGLVVYAILMCCTFSIETGWGANLLISVLGLSWALAQWVPLSLAMEYIRSIEETTMVRLDTDHAVLGSPIVPTSPLLRIPAKHEPRLSEQSPLLPTTADQPELHLSPQSAVTVHGGTYLAMFNLASVVPHFLVVTAGSQITIITTTMLSIVQLITTSKKTTRSCEPENPMETLWLFRLSGLLACLAVVLSRSLVVPTSELDYWDEIKFQIYEDTVERQLANQIEDR
ncbi:hypothetical protein VP01_3344g2 [Puccinia sorghi]|uniref:Uncharacterized protein n=1 Tax=Puccinia sorghi TaxID=27349 RepID=A0A0L6UX15_9BASI|nr:hypothetical protein VP01_3344g2 [Puccinia sorghi]